MILAIGLSALSDLKNQKIPNSITFSLALFGLAYHAFNNGLPGIFLSFMGLFTGVAIFIVPYILGGMGAGDAKLMGGIGTVLGPKGVFITGILSVFIGFIYAIILLAIHSNYGISFFKRSAIAVKTFFFTRQWIYIPPESEEKRPTLCYALPIALGTLIYIYLKATGSTLIQDLLGIRFSL